MLPFLMHYILAWLFLLWGQSVSHAHKTERKSVPGTTQDYVDVVTWLHTQV